MIFSVEQGSFGYGEHALLHDISFSVTNGEVLTILGPNGVGKTTLLRCMMGLLPWQTGTTSLDQIPMKEIPHRQFWQRVSYVPQQKGSAVSFSALEMVLMGRSSRLKPFEQPAKADIEKAKEALEAVGVIHLLEKKCDRMSGGELQMVLVARALCSDPEILVMDEPESNLDFRNQLVVLETIVELSKKRNIAVIVNTHYPVHALKISDKSLILSKGGAPIYGSTNEMVTEENLRNAFEIEVKIHDLLYQGQTYQSVVPIQILH
ncbi:MAG: ABC transporter ATP-binding protein [Eubacteriales bacterium]